MLQRFTNSITEPIWRFYSSITNKDTLVTIPLSQGAISEEALVQRLNESFTLADHMGVL